MPTIIDRGDGTFQWIADDRPATETTRIYNPPSAENRALPRDVQVVRTDNPPPAPYSLGRPDRTMSPVWPVKIKTANTYQLTPSARETLYDIPVNYDTYRLADGSVTKIGEYNPSDVPGQRWMRYWTGASESPLPVTISSAWKPDPVTGPYQPPNGRPESVLMHEFIHQQQYENPAFRPGMEAYAESPWLDVGNEEYMGTDNPYESQAKVGERPWRLSDAERQTYYPGVFQPNYTSVSQAPQPDPRLAWTGRW